MASFPVEPSYARAILASKEQNCTADMLDIISILSASSKLFYDASELRDRAEEGRRIFYHPSGDHLTILNAVQAYRDVAKGSAKGGRKKWCQKHFLNERTLVEASKIRDQLQQTCSKLNINWTLCRNDDDSLLISLGRGLIQNTAFLQPDGSYRQIMNQSVSIIACLV
jgi:HrpA-like RNA helicase